MEAQTSINGGSGATATVKKAEKAFEKSADSFKRTVVDGAKHAATEATELKASFLTQCSLYAREAEKKIRKHPLTAVALAAGIGVAAVSVVLGAMKIKKHNS
jgi:hypothetical protein